jgi:hypothetical protein
MTIAVRYSIVRQQGRVTPTDTEEASLLDYQLQRQRLACVLADVYGMHFTGKVLKGMYETCQAELHEHGDSPNLGLVHALASGLKTLFTTETAKGVELCR